MDEAKTREALRTLFSPRSVAIVGASQDPLKLSGRPLPNLLRSRFDGDVFVVNPRAASVAGLPTFPSLAAIGKPVDVALLVVPPAAAVTAAEEAARIGVQTAIVGVSGFAESGDEMGRGLQERLTALSQQTGMRIVGPNTNGIYNANAGISIGYNSAHGTDIPPGSIGIISHSGAMLSIFAERLRLAGQGLSKFVAVGNEADLDMLDYLDYLVEDEETHVIALLMESIASGARLKQIAARASALGKRIVALKLGQSEVGARTTAAHSSRLAGSARSYQALFDQLGIATARTPEGLIAAAALGARFPLSKPSSEARDLAVLTYSGAASSITADNAAQLGLDLAELTPQTMSRLEQVPRTAPITNPLDIGGVGGVEFAGEVTDAITSDAHVRGLLVYAHVLQTPDQRRAVFEALRASLGSSGKPHIVLAPGNLTSDEREWLAEADIPFFTDTAVVLQALQAYWTWADRHPAGSAAPEQARSDSAAPQPTTTLSEYESLKALGAAGVPTVAHRYGISFDEVLRGAADIGFPVVLKADVADVAHKADLGYVELNLKDEQELEKGFDRLKAATASAPLRGYVVARMVDITIEAIAGVAAEPGLGRFLLIGLGGIYAEALDDVAMVPLPATPGEIEQAVLRTALGRVLGGPRWKPESSTAELTRALVALGEFAERNAESIEAIDVNPLVVNAEGVVAVDALIIRRGAQPLG
ncbi:acetate--CoA ligase family protein [Amycolatopsis sp. NPDC049252]|uniref:acetate--CoA ligase family protein n=1 Tax=Amycolatopsis sp. NPDC049252 TaxID=3363933 RepID=UPI00371C87D8